MEWFDAVWNKTRKSDRNLDASFQKKKYFEKGAFVFSLILPFPFGFRFVLLGQPTTDEIGFFSTNDSNSFVLVIHAPKPCGLSSGCFFFAGAQSTETYFALLIHTDGRIPIFAFSHFTCIFAFNRNKLFSQFSCSSFYLNFQYSQRFPATKEIVVRFFLSFFCREHLAYFKQCVKIIWCSGFKSLMHRS